MKMAYLNKLGEPLTDIGLLTKSYCKRFPKAHIAFLSKKDGPFYIKGERNYLNNLAKRWEGDSELQVRVLDDYCYQVNLEDCRLKIFGRVSVNHVIGEKIYIEDFTLEWVKKTNSCFSFSRSLKQK